MILCRSLSLFAALLMESAITGLLMACLPCVYVPLATVRELQAYLGFCLLMCCSLVLLSECLKYFHYVD